MNIYFPLRIIPDKTKVDFMGIRYFNMGLSLILLLTSIFLLSLKGLNFGIDFKGGTVIEAKLTQKAEFTPLYDMLHGLNLGEIHLQNIDESNIMIKLGNNSGDDQDKNIGIIKNALNTYFRLPNMKVLSCL